MNALEVKLKEVEIMFKNESIKKKKDAFQALINIIKHDIVEYNSLPNTLKISSYINSRILSYDKKISYITRDKNKIFFEHLHPEEEKEQKLNEVPIIAVYLQ